METEGLNGIIDLFSNPESTIDSIATLGMTTLVAEVLAPVFLFLSMAYMFVNSWITTAHRGRFWDQAEVKRLVIVMIMIPLIPALMVFIQQIGFAVAGATEMTPGDKLRAITDLWDKVQEGPEEEFSLLFLTMGIVYKLMALVVMIIAILLMYIVKFIVLLFSGIFIQFCIVVSPLAVAFSILPIFKDQVNKLLSSFFNACFVGFTLNILDRIFFDSLFSKIVSALNDPTADIFNYMIIASTCFTIVICYLLAFWLTSKYVGSAGAAAILSTALTATTMAVMGATKVGSMIGNSSTATSIPSREANVIKSAADAIQKKD